MSATEAPTDPEATMQTTDRDEQTDLTPCLERTGYPCLCPRHRDAAPDWIAYEGRMLWRTKLGVGTLGWMWSWRARE